MPPSSREAIFIAGEFVTLFCQRTCLGFGLFFFGTLGRIRIIIYSWRARSTTSETMSYVRTYLVFGPNFPSKLWKISIFITIRRMRTLTPVKRYHFSVGLPGFWMIFHWQAMENQHVNGRMTRLIVYCRENFICWWTYLIFSLTFTFDLWKGNMKISMGGVKYLYFIKRFIGKIFVEKISFHI